MDTDLNFHHLPDSVLLHIFSFLPHWKLAIVGKVSKRWQRISYDGTLWRYLKLESKSEETIKKIITKRSCSLLIRLNLNKCSLTPEFMVTLSGICRQMRELTLQKCFFTRPKRRFRLHILKKLKTLDARLLRGNASFIVRLLRCTPNLETLAVDETIGSSWNGKLLQKMNKTALVGSVTLRGGHDDLPIIDSYPVEIPPNGFGLDLILNSLGTYCHKLEALQLSGYRDRECEPITDGFVHLLRNCNNLSRICSFGGNTDILVMAADAEMQTSRQDVRLIKPTMLFPTPRAVTPPPSLCFDRVVYNKETSTIDDPWRVPLSTKCKEIEDSG
ncbi:hypothetical protein OS493_030105 [Desmophyllum pertusum]|uniref:F-box domain-containing protein n=1 Tax=Desmophyllum pertusum TaxID=174260 RepID=A0A9X0CWU4_9CNID|nr:hypothetical protein OS493_030105 [Desmophyllum pertusum]